MVRRLDIYNTMVYYKEYDMKTAHPALPADGGRWALEDVEIGLELAVVVPHKLVVVRTAPHLRSPRDAPQSAYDSHQPWLVWNPHLVRFDGAVQMRLTHCVHYRLPNISDGRSGRVSLAPDLLPEVLIKQSAFQPCGGIIPGGLPVRMR